MRSRRITALIAAVACAAFMIASTFVALRFSNTHVYSHSAKAVPPAMLLPSGSTGVKAGASANLSPMPKMSSERPEAMAEAFKTRRLPPPMLVTGNPDDAAASLARQIAANNDASLPALLTALQMSGFSIYSTDGRLSVVPKGPSQGLAFDTFTVASMAKLYSDGWSMSLDDLSAVLSKAIPNISKDRFDRILMSGITKSAQGDQPIRFWARTIVELGRNAPTPYDLTDPKLDPATAELNSVQVDLILERVAADRVAGSFRNGASHQAGLNAWSPSRHVRFESAVYHPSSSRNSFRLASDGGKGILDPCGKDLDRDNSVVDGTLILKSIVYHELEEDALNMGPFNAVLTIARFIAIYAAMNVEITMNNEPLVRTPDGPFPRTPERRES